MDSTEIDLNETHLSSLTNSEDYDKDLRLAAELGRYLLERNHELENYINLLQKQIDEKEYDMKLLHTKFHSTREELDTKCKQIESLDATNIELEQELILQRRENEKNRQLIKELFDLYEKTRKEYHDMENKYDKFRSKQYSSFFQSSKQRNRSYQTPKISTPISTTKRQRSNSFDLASPSSSSSVPDSPTFFDLSSVSIFQSHLTELKSRIYFLTNECTSLNEQIQRSEQEKLCLLNRVNQIQREYRDENDSLQHQLNHYKKLVEKSSNDQNSTILLSHIYSPPEHDLSLYDEVLLETTQSKSSSSYQPTNYKDLFARVYDKLKTK